MGEDKKRDFIAFEYKEIVASGEQASVLIDCYASFGWEIDPRTEGRNTGNQIMLRRNRKIINKTELTRLQRNFEACLGEIKTLEYSKTARACAVALSIGIVGTGFMAGSVFAVTAKPPIVWLCVLLAIPALSLWLLAPLAFKRLAVRQSKDIEELIEKKYDEIYELCGKGSELLL